MTYKHIKFEDSAVMRSLEKVAIKNGMVKPEENLKKNASGQTQDIPSDSFSGNLLALCEQLRAHGFNKYAADLELKFLLLKKAEGTCYDVTGEKGEDLVDRAHPDGSKKIDKEWDDFGTIETITDQHDKIVEVVEKEPKGKLANKNILNAVKIILAQTQSSREQLVDELNRYLRNAQNTLAQIARIADESGDLDISASNFTRDFERLFSESPTIDTLNAIMKMVKEFYSRLQPGVVFGVKEETWRKISGLFGQVNGALSHALDLRNQIVNIDASQYQQQTDTTDPNSGKLEVPTVNIESSQFEALINKLKSLINEVGSYTATAKVNQSSEAKKWVSNELETLNNILKRYEGVSQDQQSNLTSSLSQEIEKEEKDIDPVRTWVRS